MAKRRMAVLIVVALAMLSACGPSAGSVVKTKSPDITSTTLTVTTLATAAATTTATTPTTLAAATTTTSLRSTTTVAHAVVTAVPATTATTSVACPNGTYINVSGNRVCSPYAAPTPPAGATAQCNDLTYSMSQHRSGTCSSHGGVKVWLVNLPT